MPRLTRPPESELHRLLAKARRSVPSYAEVGATRTGHLPSGYRHDRNRIRLGDGNEVFSLAVEALRRWQAQLGVGMEVFPEGAYVEEGESVLLLIRAIGLWTTAPCRVVYVAERSDAFAFAYGTLPGHPESGEVAFAVDRSESGDVSFQVTSFSRTVDPLARVAAPVTRRIQQRVTRRYLDALAKAVSTSPST